MWECRSQRRLAISRPLRKGSRDNDTYRMEESRLSPPKPSGKQGARRKKKEMRDPIAPLEEGLMEEVMDEGADRAEAKGMANRLVVKKKSHLTLT